jgi:hypothetical protein
MPYVLEQSIQEVYEDRGWDLARSVNVRGISPRAFPTLSDLAAKVPNVIERMGYDERITMDVKAGLLARINQLRFGGGKGLMFDVRTSTSNARLFESPCVLELRNIVSDDEKAFIIGLVLIRLQELCDSSPGRENGHLHHVTLIEEAHRLLRNTATEQSGDVANPRGRAIEVFANILSEIRAYGEGIMIAEQVPTKLTPDAVKNTSLRIAHRLLAQDDRELVGKAIGLDDGQIRGLGRLTTGQAVVFAEGMQKAVLARIPLFMPRGSGDLRGGQAPRGPGKPSSRADSGCPYCDAQGIACSAAGTNLSTELTFLFRRFVNALRFDAGGTRECYDAVSQWYSAEPANGAIALRCILARLADAECDRRGTYYRWSFDVVDRLEAALIAELDAVRSGAPPSGAFAVVLGEACSVVRPPFRGCVHCESVCSYRFDAAIDGGKDVAAFHNGFNASTADWGNIVQLCMPAVAGFPAAAIAARKGAAFCFGVQQIHALQVGASLQDRFADALAEELGLEG